MKKFLLLISILSMSVLAMQGQERGGYPSQQKSPESYASEFALAVKRSLPLYDSVYQLTVESISVNAQKQCFRMNMVLDSSIQFEREKQYYLDFFSTRSGWSFDDLQHSGYDVQLYVTKGRPLENHHAAGALSVELNHNDISRHYSRISIQSYVDDLAPQLPQKMGEGERYVGIAFYPQLGLLNKVFEYDDAQWPEVRDYINGRYEAIRTYLIESMMLDTTNTVAWDAEKSDVVVRNVYYNRPRTDSVEMLIAPWMWEKVRAALMNTIVEPSSTDEIADYASQLQRQCPYAIDTNTVLAGCQYDMQRQVLVHYYEVKELAMLVIENNPMAQEAMRASVARIIRSDGFRPLAEKLLAAQVSLEFVYQTRTSKRGFNFLFTPDELKEILNR